MTALIVVAMVCLTVGILLGSALRGRVEREHARAVCRLCREAWPVEIGGDIDVGA